LVITFQPIGAFSRIPFFAGNGCVTTFLKLNYAFCHGFSPCADDKALLQLNQRKGKQCIATLKNLNSTAFKMPPILQQFVGAVHLGGLSKNLTLIRPLWISPRLLAMGEQ
jgi:hypothetical protein